VPPGPNECLVQPLHVLDNGKAVHDNQPLDVLGVVHGGTEGHQRAPVMTHDREPVMAQVPHECHHVAGHRPLGRLRVPGRIRRQRGLAVAPQVGTDHEERARQLRRHPVPGRVRTRMTVQQHHCLPLAAVARAASPHRHRRGPAGSHRTSAAPTPRGPNEPACARSRCRRSYRRYQRRGCVSCP
jgi:hypothetical protein